ncbi:putative prolyl 4-hydroxylase 10 [Hyphodiscus hymeniophilus]|uniref:Prolyl 4-hydroxylase 10 n=1 Tax=Hyphodiscus hymeniophilus TaxID=353542 RepID=A0A9P6VIL9_9HELO|nr:putative prolyl 4-hydroxylase 10 [Hyphodiscus hymeniophilus]
MDLSTPRTVSQASSSRLGPWPVILLKILLPISVASVSLALLTSQATPTIPQADFASHYSCMPPVHTVRILSYEPLILHIENFLTETERKYLHQLATPHYKNSTTYTLNGTEIASGARTSTSAFLPFDDGVVSCITQRAAEFQGFESVANVESIQATKYEEGQQFKPHYDWFLPKERNLSLNRASTFFAILAANCTNCGTIFPRLLYDWEREDEKLCKYVECGQKSLVVKPIPGSAIFWRNLHENGTGNKLTWHAGLPVLDGTKVGLNIWTRTNVSDS